MAQTSTTLREADHTGVEPPAVVPAPGAARLPVTDVRRRKPPVLSFLLRLDTLRRGFRVLTLLAVDFAGIFMALYTAHMFKEVVKEGSWAWGPMLEETSRLIAFAYLLTVLLFARSDMYSERAQRPGLPKIITCLFQVMVVALIYALVTQDRDYNSYYIFYGTLGFAIVYVSVLRWGYEGLSGVLLRAAGYRRRALLVGSG